MAFVMLLLAKRSLHIYSILWFSQIEMYLFAQNRLFIIMVIINLFCVSHLFGVSICSFLIILDYVFIYILLHKYNFISHKADESGISGIRGSLNTLNAKYIFISRGQLRFLYLGDVNLD